MQANTPYSRDFYLGQQAGSYTSASVIVPIVKEIFAPRSVCDVGCGVGTWLRAWKDNGVDDICGLDGEYVDRSQLMIDVGNFRCHDLRKPLPSDLKYDLSMSLEVAEHLPPDRSDSFIAELTALAPVALFSAAIPQQGGIDHINEQWQSYWAGLFKKRGFSPLDVIRPAVWENDAVERWYRQNTIIYCRNDVIVDYASRCAEQKLPLSIVHPKQYVEIRQEYNVAGAFGLLRDAVQRAVMRRLKKKREMTGSADVYIDRQWRALRSASRNDIVGKSDAKLSH
jgi:SAM-dependent methyltransferase